MAKTILIYRHSTRKFHSIENVFNSLLPFLDGDKIELPHHSSGVINRLKNIRFSQQLKTKLLHITGHDHYLILGLWRRKTILTIHDIEFLKRTSGLKRYILKKFWFDLPIKYASYITTISEFSKQEILSLSNYETPIRVIPNPLTLPMEYTPKAFNSEKPTILHLGTKQNKNLERLVDALKGIKCHLNIIGNPSEIVINKLNTYSIEYDIKSNLSNQEIILEYKNCDLLSFVSTYEGFGLPIIEAQTIGRPVLTSNLASMPEVAGEGALLVNPLSVNEIRSGILELISNHELREILIKKGIENVKRFDPRKIAQQYSDLYKDVINAK